MTAVELATRTWGSGKRRALLVHGITSDGGTWWRIGPLLAKDGFTVTAVDLRGHGASPRGGAAYNLSDYVADFARTEDPWDLVVGHSLGGAVLLQCAIQDPLFTSRLVLEDPWLVTLTLHPLYIGEAVLESADAMRHGNPSWTDEDIDVKVAALARVDPNVANGPFSNPWDLRSGLGTINVPTLLIGADPSYDALVDLAMGEAAAAANPLVTYTVMTGFGHSIHREGWQPYASLVSWFAGSAGDQAKDR